MESTESTTLENGDDNKLMAAPEQDGSSEAVEAISKKNVLEDAYNPADESFESSGTLNSDVTVIFNPGDEPFETSASESNVTVIHIPPPPASEEDGTPEKKYEKDSKDGSDSGVEGCAAELPRVQSRNSVDYASSCNGLDEASCDSSLVSCCSVYEDPCATLPDDCRLNGNNGLGATPGNGAPTGGEGTSEGGSESSSVAGSVSARKRNPCTPAQSTKKKVTTHGPVEIQKSGSHRTTKASVTATVNGTTSTGARAKPRTTAPKTSTLNKPPTTNATPRDSRGRTRDKSLSKDAAGRDSSTGGLSVRATSSTAASRSRTIRPDTLPSALTTEINKDLAQRRKITGTARPKCSSSSRQSAIAQTPSSTPSDDSRKSLSTVGRSTSLYTGRVDLKNSRIFDKMAQSVDGCKALETYGTLPRSPRHSSKFSVTKSSGEKPPVAHRSRSGSRDASLNRLLSKKTVGIKDTHKGLPPYPKPKSTEKTKIYHEMCSQTGLTGTDIDNCLAGVATILPNPADAEKTDDVSQTEGSWEDMQQLKIDLKKVTDENEERKTNNEKLKAEVEELKKKLEEEKADHAFARQELDRNAQRVLAMLGTPSSEHTEANDSFLELESHFQSSGQVVASQQVEIADLQSLARCLSRDLEKSLAAQKALLQQQQEMEAENLEMQDFLQEEKATLEIALKEAESENKKNDERIKQLTSELERQTEECKHLVRISEQRRQENLSLSMKLKAVERRSKELILAQGAAVSGASVALSGLGGRLAGLVDQLIMSYNISDKDFEDVIYHNEAFSRSNSSIESSPVSSKHSLKDCTPSPKRGSFVSAVIGAIRNAATHPFATKPTSEKKLSDSSIVIRKDTSLESSTDLLDSEPEPCLMMESVLEDVPLRDTYSHNMVSSCDSLRRVLSVPESDDDFSFRRSKLNGESCSLNNLTQAILNRRRVEDEEEENYDSISESENGPSEGMPLTDSYCTATSLVDQVIDVDNLVTKLLKVLRVIQLDNDTCIQELKDEKAELEIRLEIFLADKKTANDSNNFENDSICNCNGANDETLTIENGDHSIKEVNNTQELIVNGQP